MIGRILWITALLGVAGITTALQFDRQADTTPSIAPLVPTPMRGYAQTQIAIAELEANNPAAALAAAEALVRRRPMPAEHLTLLATAQAKAGKAEAAGFTVQMAAQRGWREPVAQETVLRLALGAGDKAEAARRYAALFRRDATPDALLINLGPQVLGEPKGPARETFAGIIAGATRWHEMFLQRGARVLPADAFSEVVAEAMARNAQFECDPLKRAVESLRQRDAVAAQQLAATVAGQCP
jgi:hypothetical protein